MQRTGQQLSFQINPSTIGPEQAGDQVEQRGLAGAVRADQSQHITGVQRQGDFVCHNNAAEALADILQSKDCLAQCAAPAMRVPTKPCGRRNKKTITNEVKIKPCSGPTRLDGSSRKVIPCGNATNTKAPITGPQMVPMPPSTTIVRIVADCATLNCSGLIY